MNNGSKVASFDQTEANLDKTPKTYNEFMYDNESGGGILADFDDAAKLIAKVKSDVESLHKKYNQLMGMYDTFTDYNDTMNTIINTMSSNVNGIDKSFKNILNSCHLVISEMISSDNTLIDDLDGINKIIGGKSLDESAMSGHNGMPSDVAQKMYGKSSYTDEQLKKGKITGNEPNSIGSTSNKSDIASVADDVIKGKYGTGAERQAAIEAQGYNYREVQDIVNQKMNGTYVDNGNTNMSNTPAASMPNVDVPTSSNPPSNNGQEPSSKPINTNDVNTNNPPPEPNNTNNNNVSSNNNVANQPVESTGNTYLDQINQIRMENGLKPLTVNNNLVSAANIRAQEASQKWSHTRPDGSSWSTVSSSTTGENLAYSSDPDQTVIRDWMNSPTHRDVLLADDISSAGISVYEKDGLYYIALEVG